MDFKILLKNRWLLAVGILGLVCLLLGTVWNGKPPATQTLADLPPASDSGAGPNQAELASAGSASTSESVTAIETSYANQMQAILSKMFGVNRLSVLVSVSTTNLLTLASNVRTTTDSSTSNGKETHRSTTTDNQPFTESVGGNSIPVVIHSASPQVSGVLVLVNAQDFYVAKAEIIDAITNVWDVPAYNISVEPEK